MLNATHSIVFGDQLIAPWPKRDQTDGANGNFSSCTPGVLKPWVATQNWVAAYFFVGRRNDNGSRTEFWVAEIFLRTFFFLEKKIF